MPSPFFGAFKLADRTVKSSALCGEESFAFDML